MHNKKKINSLLNKFQSSLITMITKKHQRLSHCQSNGWHLPTWTRLLFHRAGLFQVLLIFLLQLFDNLLAVIRFLHPEHLGSLCATNQGITQDRHNMLGCTDTNSPWTTSDTDYNNGTTISDDMFIKLFNESLPNTSWYHKLHVLLTTACVGR